jgi:hypothetical protein
MKSTKIECTSLFNNSRKIKISIPKELLKEKYIRYLNKRRRKKLPVKEDLKLIAFVRQAFYCQYIWGFQREMRDKLVSEFF